MTKKTRTFSGRNQVSTAAAVAAVAALAAACGSSSKSATPSSSFSTSAAAPSSAAATGLDLPKLTGQTIQVDAEWQKDEQADFQKVIDHFTELTGAKVTYTSTGDNTATVLGTAVAGGHPPDVALVPSPGLIAQFAGQGKLTALPSSVTDVVDADYAPVWKTLGEVGGKPYAVFFKAANKSTVWYRTAAFKSAGITSPPTTFDEFSKDLQTLSDSGVSGPLTMTGGDGWTLTDWFENVYIRQAGAAKYDQLTKHEIPWTDPSVTAALTTLGDLWKQSSLIQPGGSQTGFADGVTDVFGQSKGAVIYEGDFVATNITSSTKAKLGTDADFFPFPALNNSPATVVGGGDAAIMFKDSPAAEAFMKYLASPDSADIWVKLGGFTSPNKQIPNSDYPDATSQAIAKDLVSASVFRFDMSDQAPAQFGGTAGQGEWKDLQDFLAAPTSVAATEAKLEKDATAAGKF